MISIRNLTKVYYDYGPKRSIRTFFFPERERIVALEHVSLEVKAGEIYALLGPNGAGKTTLIKILCGLLKPSSGEVLIDGNHVFGAQRMIGLVLGDSMVYNLMTGRDNLDYLGHLYRMSDTQKRIRELTGFLEIGEWLDRYVSEYSLGMRLKLCLARALMHDPPVLLLDEPTLGLDPRYALYIRDKIKELGKTIILTTHYMEEAEALSERIAILHRGRLVAEGTARELKDRLKSERDPSLTDVFIALTTGP
ncbi:MAG: ABC transporter ATP-binding protein [Candidatus Omnitrophica bacterium]|nr:ABC transporter ATP-binding protein [Candidatus Omnitrophota bacterium]